MSQSPLPAQYPPYPPPPRGSSLVGCAFAVSLLVNVLAFGLIVLLCAGLVMRASSDATASISVTEKYFAGSKTARDRIAIISLDGAIMEGLLDSVYKQIEQAGKDEAVKATILRINSPGGSITASDELHRRILELKNGDEDKKIAARPLVVSMSSLAASGGYYVAAPANKIFAERSTLTGSIGVYASFPTVQELAQKVGFAMRTIKAGAVKDSGSLFKEMSPTEQQLMQDMVNDAYGQFLDVVAKGRPGLTRQKMLERFEVTPLQPDPQAHKGDNKPYTRYRADGGIFTAIKAKELGLIDEIGSLEDAVKAAATLANLSEYQAIKYQKPRTLSDLLLSQSAGSTQGNGLPMDQELLRSLLTPRVLYLAPGYEMAVVRSQQAR
ncbi:MAG: signal peptide peptidase SppA [Gemmataceae bacterium]